MNLKKVAASIVVSSFLLSGCSSATVTDKKGNDIVSSIKNKDFTADEIFNDIYNSDSGKSAYYQAVLQKVVDTQYPVNDDMETDADSIVKQIKSYYKQQYGDDYQSTLKSALAQSGFSSTSQYRESMIKQIQYANLLIDYVKKNYDQVFDDYYTQASPRYLSIIKVSVADTSAITDDEQKKLDEVQALLKTDKTFGSIAQSYSDDTNTKDNQGNLGIVDTTSSLTNTYGEDFETKALALSENEVSQPILGTDGYYIVKCTSTNKDKIKKELKTLDIDSPLISYDNYMQYLAFQSYKFKYADKDVKKEVEAFVAKALEERETSRNSGGES